MNLKEVEIFALEQARKMKNENIQKMQIELKEEVKIKTEKMRQASIKFLKREKLRLIKEKNKILYEREEEFKKELKKIIGYL
ncbi:MAG: hypothetical protein FWF50_05610 [Defluviitaleaceae bacterium]|nr:hypothetical protein [Defluviitaleaceae bacterium]